MISDFLYLLLILVGAAGIFLVIFHKTRSLEDEELEKILLQTRWFPKWQKFKTEKINPLLDSKRVENRLSIFLEKSLRIFSVFLLRMENSLHQKIQQLREMRSSQVIEKDYWFNMQNLALESRLQKVFKKLGRGMHKDFFDPLQEELQLKEQKVETPERWLNLVRFYLAKENTSDAGRILLEYWQKNKEQEEVHVLFQGIYVKTREKEADSQEKSVPSFQG